MFTETNANLLRAVNGAGPEWLEPVMLALSWLGDYWRLPCYALGLAAMAVVFRHRGERAAGRASAMSAGVLVIAFAVAAPLTAALKQALGVARPGTLEGVRVIAAADSAFSFPSGHAVFAGLLLASLWPVLHRGGRFAVALLAFGIAGSRVWLGAHFPSDVGVGLLIGIVVGTWTGWIANGWRLDKPGAIAFGLATLVFALDAGSKTAIAATLQLGERIGMLEFFNIVYWRNTGAAFSFLHDAGGWQRVLFVALALAVSAWLVREILKRDIPRALKLGYGSVLGGAVGNAFDRVFRGAVVDWLDFHWVGHHWPAFNAADAAITGGLLVLMAAIFRGTSAETRPSPLCERGRI